MVQKNLNTEKIAFKFVQMKFLAMHITNKKLSLIYLRYEIYKISSWIFTWYPNNVWHICKIDHFDPYNVFLVIATNITIDLRFCGPGSQMCFAAYLNPEH